MTFRILFASWLLVGSCFAAVDGEWRGSVNTQNGPSAVGFSFQSSGATLTGTNSTQLGEAKVNNGKIDGDVITFTVELNANGMPLTLSYRGVVVQDQIKFTVDVFGMPLEFVASRVPGATAAPTAAAGTDPISGKWAGTMSTPGGDFPVNFTFAADGAKLTGTTSGPEGDIAIANGKVDGSKVSFAVSFDFGGMPLTMNYSGAVAGDEIKFTIDVLGMPLEVTAKRVK